MRMPRRDALCRGTATVAAIATAAGAVAAVSQSSDSELLALSDRYWALREEMARLDGSPRWLGSRQAEV